MWFLVHDDKQYPPSEMVHLETGSHIARVSSAHGTGDWKLMLYINHGFDAQTRRDDIQTQRLAAGDYMHVLRAFHTIAIALYIAKQMASEVNAVKWGLELDVQG